MASYFFEPTEQGVERQTGQFSEGASHGVEPLTNPAPVALRICLPSAGKRRPTEK
jgi:hypothetical protein